jgi:hypothetical protein
MTRPFSRLREKVADCNRRSDCEQRSWPEG